jgi:hypothetical protein
LLPGRSGISSVRSSSSCTKPGASPLDEQSMLAPFDYGVRHWLFDICVAAFQ